MEPTIKLYDTDAYRTEFTATVLSCEELPSTKESKEPRYDIILDQTLFFPEEGGQNADTGTMNGCPVLDVQIKDAIIHHTLATPLLPDTKVDGCIDWNMRYSNMQQHSGEHIMSGLIHSHFGYDNVGFHLGQKNVTLDFNGFLTSEQLEMIETLANEAIYKNIEVIAEYPSKEELETLTYRSKIELSGPVRIVTFPGYDVCACCAPHVKRTGEIGMIKIVDAIKYKGGIRISILCGNRALEDYRMFKQQASAISVLLSAKQESLTDAVQKLKDDNFALKGQIIALQNALIEQKASSIPNNTKNLFLFEDTLESMAHKNYVNLLVEKCTGICAVFVGNDMSGYRYIISSRFEDVRPVNEQLKKQFQAKGGGSAEMVQGSLTATQEQLCALLQS